MSTSSGTDVSYDPYDFDIDADPYPVWRHLRDEVPLYRNEQHDFWALTSWEDVEAGLKDHRRLISGKGTILELIAKGSYGSALTLATDDLDGLFKRLVDGGADVLQEPMDQPYGLRHCALRDPAGNMIRIQQLVPQGE